MVRISLRVPRASYHRLQVVAARQGARSASSLIRELIDRAIAASPVPPDATPPRPSTTPP